ncbi:hypothetical protein DSC45_23365 [Streptomyces sp. YIM 130001]|uniref:LmeA family phospholipid-binding protein n=1 Tax=Streptomyces sp. YIM 130001 TaxID=2259644 RepID=UPI000E64EB12|nr:DUF2993 domain-containing protein [Streptomyces sp. YIM 130001]RII13503.1 hypothetical protein DSC45_23365 [Streptomyces sp. YIM 130001]
MRTTPHRIPTQHPAHLQESDTPPHGNPYDELADLAGNPLDEFLYEEEPDEEQPWQPPNHRRGSRRRNRFAGLPLAAKAVVALVVLTAFLGLGDRWALLYAEHEAADKLKDSMKLSAAPEVEIEGFPFLTQAFDDKLDRVRVTVPDVAADRVSLAQVTAVAHDVTLRGGVTSFKGADIDTMDGEVLLSFEDLNRELGASQVTFTGHGGDRVVARGTLPVAGHDLKVAADARIRRSGDRGISTSIGGMRLDIGDLATYRPGTGKNEGLHLSRKSVRDIRERTDKAKALFAIPEIVSRLGVPDSAVRTALRSERKMAELTGSPEFVRSLMKVNLIDVALDHPQLLKRLGFDPALLEGLSELTRPRLASQLSLGFRLPEVPGGGDVRLRDVRVEKDGIKVSIEGAGVTFGT